MSYAMSDSPLLYLPREIRNMIYELLNTTTRISPYETLLQHMAPHVPRKQRVVLLEGTATPACLCVSRQFSDEYCEQVASKAVLHIDRTPGGALFPEDLILRAGVPKAILHAIKKCTITLSWGAWCFNDKEEAILQFHDACMRGAAPDQALMEWTPAKELCTRIKALLATLSRLINPRATVELLFALMGWVDPTDPYSVCHRKHQSTANLASHGFHKATILGSTKSTTTTSGLEVRLKFIMVTPLFSEMAMNSAKLVASRKAWEDGTTDETLLPVSQNSAQHVLWSMRPIDDSEG